jgi:hypothetical protein
MHQPGAGQRVEVSGRLGIVVEPNPENSLGLTDVAGNPCDLGSGGRPLGAQVGATQVHDGAVAGSSRQQPAADGRARGCRGGRRRTIPDPTPRMAYRGPGPSTLASRPDGA